MNSTISIPRTQCVSLYYREGSSDKVYQAAIEPEGDFFLVTFAFGRRDSTLNTGIKTPEPVDYETAKRIYEKLVREKMAKGYTEGPNGTPYQHTERADRATGLIPQPLNPIDENEAKLLLKDDRWAMQEKLDGRRMLIRKDHAEVHGLNRKGLLIGLPETVFGTVRSISGSFILDGEGVGDLFYAFDLLEWDGGDLDPVSYQRRLVKLSSLLNRPGLKHIQFIETATDPANKERLFRQLHSESKEGAVFKRLDAPYTPGRPNSGGNQLKHKFVATCSAVVSKINDGIGVALVRFACWAACIRYASHFTSYGHSGPSGNCGTRRSNMGGKKRRLCSADAVWKPRAIQPASVAGI